MRGVEKTNKVALNDLYASPNILRAIKSRMRWARNVAHMGKGKCVYRDLMGKSEVKRTTLETQAYT